MGFAFFFFPLLACCCQTATHSFDDDIIILSPHLASQDSRDSGLDSRPNLALLLIGSGRPGHASRRLPQTKGCMNNVEKESRAGAAVTRLPADVSRPARSQAAGT